MEQDNSRRGTIDNLRLGGYRGSLILCCRRLKSPWDNGSPYSSLRSQSPDCLICSFDEKCRKGTVLRSISPRVGGVAPFQWCHDEAEIRLNIIRNSLFDGPLSTHVDAPRILVLRFPCGEVELRSRGSLITACLHIASACRTSRMSNFRS